LKLQSQAIFDHALSLGRIWSHNHAQAGDSGRAPQCPVARKSYASCRTPSPGRIENAPFIYPTLLTFYYRAWLFQDSERVADWILSPSIFPTGIAELGGGTWQGFRALVSLIFATLIPFVGYGELGKVLGEGKLERIFFQATP
jgi:hypothetical protein